MTEAATATSADALLAGLDPEQREVALAARGPVCVLAGAGTGKTRAITHRIAYAAAAGLVDPAHVLAVTFTVRAAAYAMRCVIARVLPVPAPASTQTGPRAARATSACSGSSPASSASAEVPVTASVNPPTHPLHLPILPYPRRPQAARERNRARRCYIIR